MGRKRPRYCMPHFYLNAVLFCHIAGFAAKATEAWPTWVGAPDFLPGCAELLLERPELFQGGGALVEGGDAWLAVGVGTALSSSAGQRPEQEEEAWKKANDAALAALAEALWGVKMDAFDSTGAKSGSDGEGRFAADLFINRTGIERAGLLAGSLEAGRWKLRNASGMDAEVGVLRVAASPGHPLVRTAGLISVVSDTLDPVWRDEVLSRPALRHGGACIVSLQGRTWFLVSGCTPLTKAAAHVPPAKIRSAEDNARVEWSRFVQGVQIRNHVESSLEMLRFQREDHQQYERTVKILSSITEGRVRGRTPGMIPIGMWLADAGESWRLAAVFRLSMEEGASAHQSYPMTRPPIPNMSSSVNAMP